jgi:acyl dehydratase
VSSSALYFDDVEVGQRFVTASRTVTEADVVNFAGISGDFNPLHMDAAFAERSVFGRRVAHGLLVLAISTGLRQGLGVFSGTLMALLEVRAWRFRAPVFPGDTVRVEFEIAELRETSKPDRGVVVQRMEVRNQDDAIVQEGELVALLARRT